ncbi:MAG TPA: phospholipase D family protein [Gaiellales bacterium]|jgi:phosphatidylserine/phosphatidylglycerophosphate/cardiolipin synthase-like enzyme
MISLPDLADRVDCVVGDRLEGAVRGHHRRRLRRVGWEPALDVAPAFWAAEAPAPRTGNEVEIFIDGADALPAMVRVMRAARQRVCLAGWFFSAAFALERGSPGLTLEDLLGELAERVEVYVLAWAGAPLPLFRPGRRDVRDELERIARQPGVHVAADRRERPMHCHHEKLVIVDDERAFVGGIDLTDLAGDRLDEAGHPNRGSLGWHDAASLVTGPVAGDAASHFQMRWHEVTGRSLAPLHTAERSGGVQVQLVRTVPEHVYDALPRGEFTILAAYLGALRAAERLIYLENQFLWSSEVVAVLQDKLRNPPCDEFRIVLVLPSRPNNGADDTRGQLGVLVEADAGQGRFLACTIYSPAGPRVERVYVHAKIGIVDDRWLTLGSANLNEHSLFNDTEVNIVVNDERLARETRTRLWAEHLELPEADLQGDPCRVIDELWAPRARAQRDRVEAHVPVSHRLVELPQVSRRSKRLFGPIQSLLVDG